ncbi:MAG: hypothetical protein HDR21_14015 [Lachnospiraceae bacterium]|nr:hypothetical protein [Lachnospiraceae bacterium]
MNNVTRYTQEGAPVPRFDLAVDAGKNQADSKPTGDQAPATLEAQPAAGDGFIDIPDGVDDGLPFN